MAELVDALDLGSSFSEVGVQVLSPAPQKGADFISSFLSAVRRGRPERLG